MIKPLSLYRPFLLALTATSLVASPAAASPSLLAQVIGMAGIEQRGGVEQRERNRDRRRDQVRDPARDQDRAFRATREGRSMPLPMIERRVKPHMGGADYLGPELRGETYRLKYMQDGRVIWVDVDAATGRIVRRSGD